MSGHLSIGSNSCAEDTNPVGENSYSSWIKIVVIMHQKYLIVLIWLDLMRKYQS